MARNWSQKLMAVDESPATVERLDEVYAAIRERRFRPWHAGDLLSVAHTPGDRRATALKIVDLVAKGAEGRRMVVVLPTPPKGKSQMARERAVARRMTSV